MSIVADAGRSSPVSAPDADDASGPLLARPGLPTLDISPGEADAVRALAETGPADLAAAVDRFALLAQELPLRLRELLLDFRLREQAPACLIRGLHVPADLGPTPTADDAPRTSGARAAERTLALIGEALGEVFGWAHEQEGRLVHDVTPRRGSEDMQVGSSSSTALAWHTEEAFDDDRADYLGLFCLRNPDQTATTLASVDDLRLDFETQELLRRPVYGYEVELSFQGLMEGSPARTGGRLVAPLSGTPASPYLRVDPVYVDLTGARVEERRAYHALCAQIDGALRRVVLTPGDLLFVDNYRAVHGRSAFRGRFDGTDRWLMRVNVTRDLRRSRARRTAPAARVIW